MDSGLMEREMQNQNVRSEATRGQAVIAALPDRAGFVRAVTAQIGEEPALRFQVAHNAAWSAYHQALRQGIDAHLEAVEFDHTDGVFTVATAESLHTLLRRLCELRWPYADKEIARILDGFGFAHTFADEEAMKG
jgi:hypothetical protein